MSHFNEIVVKTAKVEGSTIEDIKSSLASHYPDFTIQNINEEGSEWKATLLKEISVAEMAKMAAFPFEEEDGGDEEVEEVDVDEVPEEEEEETTSSPASDDVEEDGEEKVTSESEVKHIEELLLELKDQVKALQDKAGLVDEIHESTKPHVGLGPEEVPTPEEIGPTAPEGGNPLGIGGPAGGPPGGPVKPVAASNAKIAYASIKEDGFEFSLVEVAEAMQERYPKYRIARIDVDENNNRYVARLELK